jgi:hypothetical protein
MANVVLRVRLPLFCVATVAGLLVSSATASAQYYPACNLANCSMTAEGNGDVMTGGAFISGSGEGDAVNVYPIFYGPWTGTFDSYLALEVYALIESISDSVYEATAQSYKGPNGATSGRFVIPQTYEDSSEHMGPLMNDTFIEDEIMDYAWNAGVPIDPNGIYLFLADSSVQLFYNGGGYGSTFCAYNEPFTYNGTNFHLAVVGNPGDPQGSYVNGCTWNAYGQVPTPNTAGGIDEVGAIDFTMSLISHELNETMTDPLGVSGGWWYTPANNKEDTQMADLCGVGRAGFTYAVPPNDPLANFHGKSGDFLLQMLRANANNGYCVNSYGGFFGSTNFGFTFSPIGDWSFGNYKGECAPGQPVNGLSLYGAGAGHAVMCGSQMDAFVFPQSSSCFFKAVGGGSETYSCPATTEFVAGVSQSTSGIINGLLCCQLSGSTAIDCGPQAFNSSNLGNSDTPYDWDYGFTKADCSSGWFMFGITMADGVPSSIQCCNPS